MKLIKIISNAVPIIAGCLVLSSCEKKTGNDISLEQDDLSNRAVIQVFNASIPSAATDPRRNYVYVDAAPVTGSPLAYGGLFPSASTGFSLDAGLKAFLIRDTIRTGLQPQIVFSENFQAGNNYTIFMYDTFTMAKQKTVNAKIIIPSDSTARVRVANFVYHPTAIPGIDIFSKRRNEYIVTNLLPTQVTEFMPYASARNDTLYVTESGNPANRLDTLNGFNPTPKRSYTLIFRGRWRTNEVWIADNTPAPNARVLSVFTNN